MHSDASCGPRFSDRVLPRVLDRLGLSLFLLGLSATLVVGGDDGGPGESGCNGGPTESVIILDTGRSLFTASNLFSIPDVHHNLGCSYAPQGYVLGNRNCCCESSDECQPEWQTAPINNSCVGNIYDCGPEDGLFLQGCRPGPASSVLVDLLALVRAPQTPRLYLGLRDSLGGPMSHQYPTVSGGLATATVAVNLSSVNHLQLTLLPPVEENLGGGEPPVGTFLGGETENWKLIVSSNGRHVSLLPDDGLSQGIPFTCGLSIDLGLPD